MSTRRDDPSNKSFEQILRDMAPPARLDDAEKRSLRTHLHFYMRARSRRFRNRMATAAVTVLAVLLMPFGGRLVSINFDMEESTGMREDQVYFESIAGGSRSMMSQDFEDDTMTAAEAASILKQLYVTGEVEIYEFDGWEIGGHRLTTTSYRANLNGKIHDRARSENDLEREHAMPIIEFTLEYTTDFLNRIENGEVPRHDEGIWERERMSFQVYSWTIEYPDYGPVTYYQGTPVD